MTPDQVAVMWMIGTAGEIIARSFFGQLTKHFETTQLYILWSTISTIQMCILCFNKSVYLFWVAIFLNGLAIGGSAGLKMVLIIEMIGIELQRAYIVMEQCLTAPLAFILPLIGFYIADYMNQPSMTYYLSLFGAVVNLCLTFWMNFIGKDIRKAELENSDIENSTENR